MHRIAKRENEPGPAVMSLIELQLRNATVSGTYKQTHNFQNICLLLIKSGCGGARPQDSRLTTTFPMASKLQIR
jgi:hypothetical protein